MYRFEAGKYYQSVEIGFDPLKVVRRTEKTVWVENMYGRVWAWRVHTDKDSEYVYDRFFGEPWECAYKAWFVLNDEEQKEWEECIAKEVG